MMPCSGTALALRACRLPVRSRRERLDRGELPPEPGQSGSLGKAGAQPQDDSVWQGRPPLRASS